LSSLGLARSIADNRWAGTLELPLDELLEGGAAQRGR
jgi:hypothetical protein